MKLVTLKYTGKKPYTDKTAMRTEWREGDTNQVLENDAKMLTKFAEFTEVKTKESAKAEKAEKAEQGKTKEQDLTEKTPEQIAREQALLQKKLEEEEAERQDRDLKENMLREVPGWNKEALVEYGKKYDVKLDMKSKVGDLRAEVANLIEVHGVR